ncbi:MAG: HdeD family acid-resistance protein [Hyphomicrobiales bacterium]
MSESIPEPIKEKWSLFLFSGLFFVVGGILAIMMPLASTIAVKLIIGAILVVTGLVELVQAFGVKGWFGFIWKLAVGLIFVIAGVYLFSDPLTGVLTLTLLVALTFFAQGVLEIVYGFQMRPANGANWIIFSGVISVVAGALIFSGFPSTATWVLGFLAGISLISSGITNIALGLAGRKALTA